MGNVETIRCSTTTTAIISDINVWHALLLFARPVPQTPHPMCRCFRTRARRCRRLEAPIAAEHAPYPLERSHDIRGLRSNARRLTNQIAMQIPRTAKIVFAHIGPSFRRSIDPLQQPSAGRVPRYRNHDILPRRDNVQLTKKTALVLNQSRRNVPVAECLICVLRVVETLLRDAIEIPWNMG